MLCFDLLDPVSSRYGALGPLQGRKISFLVDPKENFGWFQKVKKKKKKKNPPVSL